MLSLTMQFQQLSQHHKVRDNPGGVNMSNRHLVGADMCARALGITKGCLYRMAREGLIPSYRVGVQLRGVRFDLDEVRETLKRYSEEAG